jgi:hypothetical protein
MLADIIAYQDIVGSTKSAPAAGPRSAAPMSYAIVAAAAAGITSTFTVNTTRNIPRAKPASKSGLEDAVS